MRQDGPYGLGVDLGTSNTVAVIHTPDGRTRPLLFDGQPLMPSGVFLDQAGRLHVGRDAQRLAQADPARYEPNPKRRIDESAVLLGDREVPVVDLLAAVLGAVARAAVESVGFLPPAMLTHPAAWGPVRRETLAHAVARAGWPPVSPDPARPGTRFTPEPVAAARYFAEVLSRPVPVGSALAVFDFGGGTLDVAVVRNGGAGPTGRPVFTVVSSGGVADLGGLDLDAAMVDHIGRMLTSSAAPITPDGPTQRLDLHAAAAWQALTQPSSVTQWRNRRQLWDDVRGAKEMLSRATVAPIAVPGVEHAVHLTREELEQVVTPLLRRGVHETAGVIRAAGVAPDQLAGLFLVGGSSRVPMVGRLLHSDLHIPPTVLEQPELPVAEGALAELLSTTAIGTPPVSPAPAPTSGPPVSGAPASGPPVSGAPASGPPVWNAAGSAAAPPMSGPPAWGATGAPPAAPSSRRKLLPLVAAVVVLVVLVTVGVVVYLKPWDRTSPVTFQTMTEGTLLPGVTDKPDGYVSGFYTTVAGDRAYAAAQREDKTLEIIGIDLTNDSEIWRVTTSKPTSLSSWKGLYATDRYVIADGDALSDQPRPLMVYDRAGKALWDRTLRSDDQFLIFDDILMLIDSQAHTLRGLRLADGREAWSYPVPKIEYSDYFRLAWISSSGDLAGPATANGAPLSWNAEAPQRFVLVTPDKRARVLDAGSGQIVSERPVPVEPADLSTSGGVQILADQERLYIGTRGDGYRIDAYDLDTSADPVVVHNGGPERTLKTMIPCGDGRICLADAGAAADSDEVAEITIADGNGKEAWRKPAPGLTAATGPGAIVATGAGLLVWHRTEDDTYRSMLIDEGGETAFDLKGIAARVNPRSFLLFDRVPSGTGKESVPLSGVLDSGTQQQLGTLVDARLSTCSWNRAAIVCGSGDNGFRVQHFAEG